MGFYWAKTLPTTYAFLFIKQDLNAIKTLFYSLNQLITI